MIKAVLDTNILISAIFWRGNEYKVVSNGIDREYNLVISPQIIEELIDKLKNKFKFQENKIQELIDLIFTFYEIIEPVSTFLEVRDVKDNKILECAYDGKADYIVTGDKDLLVLEEFKGIKIIQSWKFLELFK